LTTRNWKTAEAIELAGNVGVSSPEEAVRRCARRLLDEHAGATLPVRLHSLFDWGGVRKVRSESMTLEGGLRCLPDGRFDILVREDAPTTRQRFSIAHELGHLIFYRHAPRAKALQAQRGARAPQEEERLCNVAAEELLMPSAAIDPILARAQGTDRILQLAADCEVSIEAAMVRLAPLWRARGELQLWQYRDAWKPTLVRRLGRTTTSLATFVVEEWRARPTPDAATLPLSSRTSLHSRSMRMSLCAETTAVAIPRRVPTILICHELTTKREHRHETDLEAAALRRDRRAWAAAWITPPRPDCALCRGEGLLYPPPERRLEPTKLCSCRYRDGDARAST